MSPFKKILATRRNALKALGGAALFAETFAQAAAGADPKRYFYFAVIADTHIIDEKYRGPESNQEDTDSLMKASQRLTTVRSFINSLQPRMEAVFLVGDYFHNYPSADWDYYFQNTTRVDLAKNLTDGFSVPVHVGFGNHDYDVPRVPREFSHKLFKAKFALEPYYALEYKGYQFIHLNNFVGETWNPGSKTFNRDFGSLGETQLNWLDTQLAKGSPAFVFVHYPLPLIAKTEASDYGLVSVLKKHQAKVQRVVSGHWHRWHDFGAQFGPPALVIAATRYDENAYMLVEVDTAANTHRWMNSSFVEWDTHYAKPYRTA